MSTPVIPTVIRGPGIILFNSFAYYFKEAMTIRPRRGTTAIADDFHGTIDMRHESVMVDIEATPAGELKSLANFYPYGPTNLVAASPIGNSIFTGADVPLVIATKAGLTMTFARGGIARMPSLFLSPRKTVFGTMGFSAIGMRAQQQTTDGWLKAIAAADFGDTSFDDTRMLTDVYAATLGSRAAPYDAIGARQGFELEPVLGLDDVPDDNVGVADRIITDVGWKCRFAPNNLTMAQVDAIANWDGADAIIPGQSVARGPAGAAEDLIISADALTATLHTAGLTQQEIGVGVKVDMNGNIEFFARQTFTSGVANPFVTLDLH
jgi:hypothetical protein